MQTEKHPAGAMTWVRAHPGGKVTGRLVLSAAGLMILTPSMDGRGAGGGTTVSCSATARVDTRVDCAGGRIHHGVLVEKYEIIQIEWELDSQKR